MDYPVGARVIFKSHHLANAMRAGVVVEMIEQSKFGPMRRIRDDDGNMHYVPLQGMMTEGSFE